MADYSGWQWTSDPDNRVKEIQAERRIKELREGYTSFRGSSSVAYSQCIRCGCLVGNRKIHDERCPWSEEMFQVGLEKLGEL